MLTYYTSIILLSLLGLIVLCILVWENDRLPKSGKNTLHIAYAILALATLSEWFGIQLSGRENVAPWIIRTVKCADYIFTPMTGWALSAQLRSRSVRIKILYVLLGVNTVFQIVSVFTGWMVQIDAQNRYSHGPLYTAYSVFYIVIIVLVIFEFAVYGTHFRRQNRRSLYAILFLVLAGILMQELCGQEIRTSYIALTMGMSMMYIHYAEFSMLAADDAIQEQHVLITTDALTGLYSRHTYTKALHELNAGSRLPENLAAFSIDVNGLKAVNDTFGHEAGDELICGAASCISAVLGDRGSCFRTGGDEFIVLAEMDRDMAETSLAMLAAAAADWRGKKVRTISLAAGFALAADYPDLDAEKLVQMADRAMYEAKEAYYRENGLNPR